MRRKFVFLLNVSAIRSIDIIIIVNANINF